MNVLFLKIFLAVAGNELKFPPKNFILSVKTPTPAKFDLKLKFNLICFGIKKFFTTVGRVISWSCCFSFSYFYLYFGFGFGFMSLDFDFFLVIPFNKKKC